MDRIRLTDEQKRQLIDMGLEHVVVIARDVSVQCIGSVQSAHSLARDALKEATRLSEMYERLTARGSEPGIANGFVSVELKP